MHRPLNPHVPVIDVLNALGCNPVEGLANIAADAKTPPSVRRAALAELASYLHPRLKAVEHSVVSAPTSTTAGVSPSEMLGQRIARIVERRAAGKSAAGASSVR